MLITFRSKASPDVMMYKEHAKRILDLLGKDADRGVITAAEAPNAVDTIERETGQRPKINPHAVEVQVGVGQILTLSESGYTVVRP